MGLSGLWGQFSLIIDDKGRMTLPTRIRNKIEGESLILTKGMEKCLCLYELSAWDEVAKKMIEKSSSYSPGLQNVLRRFVAPAEEVILDKAGRVKLTPSLVKFASIVRDCYLVCMGNRLELWAEAVYEGFEEDNAADVRKTWEDLGSILPEL